MFSERDINDRGIIHRAYQGPVDDPRIRDLLHQHYAATRHPYYAADPPNWERISAALRLGLGGPGVQLWEHEQQPRTLVGFVLCQKEKPEFSCLVHPDNSEIEDRIYDWLEEEAGTALLRCSVCEKNEGQKAVLARRGYVKGELATVFRRRSLDGALHEVVLPEGYRFQEAQGLSAEPLAERARAEGEVMGGAVQRGFLRELQRTPIYRSELDLVVTAPGGPIAAFCTLWFDDHHQVGYVEPIGTVAAHRRRSLGKTLLLEGFRRLQEMGAAVVYLGHSAGNSAGSQLYESAGLAVFDQEHWWQKAL